jgi:RimJ/RimL family protein N-acetyltransferase
MQKLGMQREGVWRRHLMRWDRFEDAVACGILRDEWRP